MNNLPSEGFLKHLLHHPNRAAASMMLWYDMRWLEPLCHLSECYRETTSDKRFEGHHWLPAAASCSLTAAVIDEQVWEGKYLREENEPSTRNPWWYHPRS